MKRQDDMKLQFGDATDSKACDASGLVKLLRSIQADIYWSVKQQVS